MLCFKAQNFLATDLLRLFAMLGSVISTDYFVTIRIKNLFNPLNLWQFFFKIIGVTFLCCDNAFNYLVNNKICENWRNLWSKQLIQN